MLPIGQPSNGKIPGEKLPLKVGYFWTGLMHSGTWRPVKVYQKISRAPGGQTGAATEPKLAGHTRTVPT